MGISKLVGLKGSIFLLGFLYFRNSRIILVPIPLLHASLVAFLVSIAAHPAVNLPLLLGKSSDGKFPLWSMLLFGPYLASVRIFVFLRRLKDREPIYSEVADGLYVGGWPSSPDHLPPGEPAVVDCTCELPRISALSRNGYLCVATWDTRAPRPSEIESAVRWACRKRAQKKPVYIHCAFGQMGLLSVRQESPQSSLKAKKAMSSSTGHGRSVCVMCALLVALGIAEDWKAAEKIIKEKRSFIQMNALHRRHLEEWSKHRISSKPNGELDVSSVIQSENS